MVVESEFGGAENKPLSGPARLAGLTYSITHSFYVETIGKKRESMMGTTMDSKQQAHPPSSTVFRAQSTPTEDTNDGSLNTPGSAPGPGTPLTSMSYNCQPCVRRKVKCDRLVPTCSSCVKTKQNCIYQAPPKPRRKKRKGIDDSHDTEDRRHATADEDISERLARYERILRENGLLDVEGNATSPATQRTAWYPTPVPEGGLPPSRPSHFQARPGKLVAGDGKSRYIDSNLWLDTGAEDIQDMSDDAEAAPEHPLSSFRPGLYDPVSGALLGLTHDLLDFHPSYEHAMALWTAHMQNVEPLCRILHIPTTAKMVETVARQPSTASKAQECQLFAIYHFAVYSMDEEDCLRQFGQSRSVLLPKYAHALRQALVNASWLKTTEMPVMQAYMLFLISGRTYIDPHTYWMLTGIGVRIAQRMGLHHDGEGLGLPPFEVQMRRRLFWQLIPLDGFAGQHSGTGISMLPSSWDVKMPLNVNDDQIYPGMTEWPEEEKGATDMIYVLCRAELSNYYSKVAVRLKENGPAVHLREGQSSDQIDDVERTIEEKYLRYCDIIDPLHYLVLLIVRSAANVVRLRTRIKPLKNHNISEKERRELCGIAQKILEGDNAIYRSHNLKNFRWQVKEFFLWDALICMLTSLTIPGFFSRTELDVTWAKLIDVWSHHPELLETWRPVHVMAGKAILEAWTANPPTKCEPEPYFVTALKARRNKARRAPPTDVKAAADLKKDVTFARTFDAAALGEWSEAGLLTDNDFSPGVGDFVFWDQFFLNAEMSQIAGQDTGRDNNKIHG
ncbi:hypothetical protein N0V93_002154 [Gnomoniopsis smithogilvyi]|uniref:Zn(2)-C6 fungal-type domain-containing protein n=1 Tax=Gnomoniopsis smithogilvyi TaxID=1191159 RepID=A0A9W9CXF3_9PEZI|nr:hypothetical protein N0V93_002154 [Gnomoniopsis smithogilvyi]